MGPTPAGKTREKIYLFVRRRILAGRPPTVREVQEAFGFKAVQSARQHLEKLVQAGRLRKEPGKARGYRLPADLGPGYRTTPVLVPLLGRVQAGALTTAEQEAEGYVVVQTRRASDQLFALRIRGESMRNAGILPGDVVIVRQQPRAESGEIVVALVEDEATVKRLRWRTGRLELQAENPAFSSIMPDPEAVRILGKVIEVRRYLESPPREEIMVP
jgi:repressor LexA